MKPLKKITPLVCAGEKQSDVSRKGKSGWNAIAGFIKRNPVCLPFGLWLVRLRMGGFIRWQTVRFFMGRGFDGYQKRSVFGIPWLLTIRAAIYCQENVASPATQVLPARILAPKTARKQP